MKNLTISKRLAVMIASAVIALIVVGIVGLSTAKIAERGVRSIRDDSLASILVLSKARNDFMRSRVNAYIHVLSTQDEAMDAVEKNMKNIEAGIDQSLKDYEKLLSSDEDKRLLENDKRLLGAYAKAFWDRVVPASRKHQTDAAAQIVIKELRPVALELAIAFDKHMQFNEEIATSYTDSVIASVSSAINFAIGLIVVAALALGVFGYMTMTAIRRSLTNICDSVNRIESNLDFTVRAEVERQDEIGITASAFNRLLDKLQGNLKTIMDRTETVAHSASQMATTSNEVAVASHQQSEAASNMAATVEEMTVSINHVGDRAQEANRISNDSGNLASEGESVIGRTVNDINQISQTVNHAAERIKELVENSQRISSVVAVIKEVADQTNLLALNAAIEAARAGEQGRGFAVVADEVRTLAERTSTSTQEIALTIDSMRTGAGDVAISMESVVREVNQGVESAKEASNSISQIGIGSQDTVEVVVEISSAIREQASAMNSIAQQVEKIAQMSEESSAAAGNSAQIARDLDVLAEEMKQIVSAYRL